MILINAYWDLALKAQLPNRIFDLIVPNFHRLPLAYDAYCKKLGYSPITVNKSQARRMILELLIEGPRYISEIQNLFSITAEMRREVLSELVDSNKVVFEFCPIGNCISYDLAPYLRIPKKAKTVIDNAMRESQSMNLYQLSLRALDIDYAVICVFAKSVLNTGSYKYDVGFDIGNVVLSHKGSMNEKA